MQQGAQLPAGWSAHAASADMAAQGYHYFYVDPQGQAEGYEDVFTKLEAARRHYAATGRDEAELRALMR